MNLKMNEYVSIPRNNFRNITSSRELQQLHQMYSL
jgi:hypothetical protein